MTKETATAAAAPTGKRVAGRTIAMWKKALLADGIDWRDVANDKAAIKRLAAYRRDGGYADWEPTAGMLAKWRAAEAKAPAVEPAAAKAAPAAPAALYPEGWQARQEADEAEGRRLLAEGKARREAEGELGGQLRRLVELIGKDGAKKLIDAIEVK